MSATPARPKGNWTPAGIRRDERQGSIFHSRTSGQDDVSLRGRKILLSRRSADTGDRRLVVMALELLAEGSVQVQFIIYAIISLQLLF